MTESNFAEATVVVFLLIYVLAVYGNAKAWSLFCKEPSNDADGK